MRLRIALLASSLVVIACKKEEPKVEPVAPPVAVAPRVIEAPPQKAEPPPPPPRSDRDEAAIDAAFWKWTADHLKQIKAVKKPDDAINLQLSNELDKVAEGLSYELGVGKKPFELIISADGDKRLFPLVKRLVATAPALPDTKVIAFRPRKDVAGLGIGLDDNEVNADDLYWKGTPDEDRPGFQSLQIFVKDVSEADLPNVRTPALLLVDAAVGEFDMETRIGNVELSALPNNAGPEFKPLASLPTWLDEQK